MKSHLIFLTASVLTLAVLPLRAQVVNDGETNTLANVTTNITGTVTVGTNGAFTLLVLSDNALLTNSTHGVISANLSARSNEVRLISPSASWLMGGTLFVGSNGAFSTLVVSNGALVRANAGIIGRQAASGSNVVLVTGAGSMWSNVAGVTGVGLTVGSLGSGNQLIVSNGGSVVNALGSGTIGSNSSNNVARVTGPGSIWSNRFGLNINPIGAGSANNGLVIEDGGQVFNEDGLINGLNGSSNNFAFITGSGAAWNNRDLYLGSSVRAGLTVSNGGAVLCANSYVGSGGSQMLVTGGGSRWNHQNDLALVGQNNTLVVTNGGSVVNSNGYIGGLTPANLSSSNNTVVVTGPGSTWSNRADLFVGFAGSRNRLVVSNGGAVRSGRSTVSTGVSGANRMFVTGTGSVWSSQSSLTLTGDVNHLEVTAGGRLECTDGALTGFNNEVFVIGNGSSWNNQGSLALGNFGNNNLLIAADGGTVLSSNAFIGASPSFGHNNFAWLLGTGALWSNRNDLVIGNFNAENALEVAEGATGIVGGNTFLSKNNGASNCTIFVHDPGSRWLLSSNLYLGSNGPFNRLLVFNGGQVVLNWDTYVGSSFSSSNNTVLVTGSGSVLSNGPGASFLLGFSSSGNRLIVSNGGLARLSFLSLSEGNIASSNEVIVTGPGSTLDPGLFVVGDVGRGNRLVVSQGSSVNSGSATVGLNVGSRNNDVLVTGAGSSWKSDLLTIGFKSPGNLLVITNGGEVRSGAFGRFVNELGMFVGEDVTSISNRIVVHGGTVALTNPTRRVVLDLRRGTNVLNAGLMDLDQLRMTNAQGVFEFNGGTLITREAIINNTRPFGLGGSGGTPAVWDVRESTNSHLVTGDVLVGINTPFNQLLVTNGAVLRDNFGILGVNSGSSSNVALVAGSGSVWSNANDLYVGRSGSRNELTVSNGGLVRNNDGYLGVNPGSSNNLVVVTDPGSVWRNAGALFLGQDGQGNRVAVTNGGIVHSASAFVGAFSGSSNNQALVAGSGSVWSNALDLSVGLFGSGNQLVASNGALVSADVGFIGHRPNANRNLAIVTGIGTQWLLSSNLCVGSNGSFNTFLLNNGGFALNNEGIIGAATTSVGNMALVSGAGTVWSNRQRVIVGQLGNGNRLEISDGARVESDSGQLGPISTANSNEVVVTGPGSSWRMPQNLTIGGLGNRNRLVITNGGSVRCAGGILSSALSTNNEVIVTGAGSSWISPSSTMFIGQVGSNCRLAISDGGVVSQQSPFGLTLGSLSTSTNNRIEVDNGTLAVTNSAGFAPFDLRRGRTVLNAGLITVDLFRMTNTQGLLELNGGTFSARDSLISNGTLFRIGNGTNLATFRLAGNGVHEFVGILAAIVSSNATFTGNGTIAGPAPLQFRPGSLLVPGTSVGKMIFSNAPSLQGTIVAEISKTGATRTNDQIQVTGPLTYGGSLVVSNLGPAALAAGDRYPLFVADTFAGGFTNITLPALPPELGWTNRLLVDGSIEVTAAPRPGFANIALSGTNVIISGTNGAPNASFAVLAATNVTLPLSNWMSLFTNQFGAAGEFSFTNAIAPTEPQRFFQLRTP